MQTKIKRKMRRPFPPPSLTKALWLALLVALIGQTRLLCVRAGADDAVPSQVVPSQSPAASPTAPITPSAATPAVVPPVTPSVAPDDTIQPDDVLEISVVGEADMTRSVTVPPDGIVTYPYIGELRVTGLTVRTVRERIRAKVATQIRNPEVIVVISKRHETPAVNFGAAIVLGAVKTPGQVALHENAHLLDLLAQSGGLTAVRPEWASATLVRGATTLPVDLTRLVTSADPHDNVPVLPGDILIVRELDAARTQVQVLGEVAHPGPVPIPSDGSLTAVIASVGGPTPQASLSRATILRGTQTIPVNLDSLLTDGKPVAGVSLQAGDTLIVPTNKRHFAVFGAVSKPGAVAYPEDKQLDVLSALALAGGQTGGADLKGVVLVRPSPMGGKPEIIDLNLYRAMSKGDLTQNVPVQPGDILFLPDKGPDHRLQAESFVGFVPSLFYLLK